MAKMNVHFICGISGDRVVVTIVNGEKTITDEYIYGVNASRNREIAEYAQKDYEDSIKYKWKSGYHCPKPFIGDILHDLIETYYIGNDDIIYSGYFVLSDRSMTEAEVQRIVDRIAEEF